MTLSTKKLRDLFSDKEALQLKRKELKEMALNKRDATVDELKEAKSEIKEIDNELRSIDEKIELLQELAENNKNEGGQRTMELENRNTTETMEYRQAFKDYVQRGVRSNVLQTRADSYTSTTTAATVIPKTIVEEIIRELKVRGTVLNKVRFTNLKGGVSYPTMSLAPVATWINEGTPSDRQALSTGEITFSYYGLEARIAQSLLSRYTSIDAFEREFVTLAVEAMVDAKEIAIFNGAGATQPTGIFQTSGIVESEITEADFVKYDKLVEAVSKLAPAYDAGAEFYMAKQTWFKIVGMVDTAGQPVARVNYGLNAVERSLFGYPVNIVETNRIKDITSAVAGTDYFVVLGNLRNYAINSNGDLGVIQYRDNDKNQDVIKALEFLDGKVLQPKAFLALKKVSA